MMRCLIILLYAIFYFFHHKMVFPVSVVLTLFEVGLMSKLILVFRARLQNNSMLPPSKLQEYNTSYL